MNQSAQNRTISITLRHESSSEALKEYATKKIENLHLEYPKIIEAKVILDVQKKRHIAEIVLVCANHIVIEADTESDDMYDSINQSISKVARQMRKHKTRLLKTKHPKPEQSLSSD